VQWAVEVMRHTLTLPQVLQHLLQLDRIETATAHRDSIRGCTSPRCQQRFSWVEPGSCGCDPLSESTGWQDCKEAEQLAALAAMPPHLLTPPQHAALVMHAWQAQAHVKPTEAFDSDAQLTLPGLADVAVVSRGGWQRHSWKTSNQDAFLALPLAAGGSGTACCSSAVAIGVFDGHGRAGQAASAHLRNALASGLCMHNQLALMAQPACQPEQQQQQQAQAQQQQAPQPAGAAAVLLEEEAAAAQLLERCFAAAASTMPSTGADFSLSGSTAVMCLVQPGSVTAAWAGDSRAVLGLHSGQRYISCALTHDHRPSRLVGAAGPGP
jgi:RNA polymerase II C-terminal domain phosphatase-like 3/4